MAGRFGRQPLCAVIRSQGRTLVGFARANDISVTQLNHVGSGATPPSDELREKLPRLLGVPLDELFTEQCLATPFLKQFSHHNGGRKPRVTP